MCNCIRSLLISISFSCIIFNQIQISYATQTSSVPTSEIPNDLLDAAIGIVIAGIKIKHFELLKLPNTSFDIFSPIRVLGMGSKWGSISLENGIFGNFSTLQRFGNATYRGTPWNAEAEFVAQFKIFRAKYQVYRHSIFGKRKFGKIIINGPKTAFVFSVKINVFKSLYRVEFEVCNLELLKARLIGATMATSDWVVSSILTKVVNYQVNFIKNKISKTLEGLVSPNYVEMITSKKGDINLCKKHKIPS